MDMRPAVSYTPYDKCSMEHTCDIITFEQFEEGILLSDNRDNEESGNKSDDDSNW